MPINQDEFIKRIKEIHSDLSQVIAEYDNGLRADARVVMAAEPAKPAPVNLQDMVMGKAPESSFRFGPKSLTELMGVHPLLVELSHISLRYSTQDFMVYDGLRTEAEQREYVRKGTSQTMLSMHRPQPDGFGHAVDLVPYAGGEPRWDWNLIYPVALAVDKAATQLGIADKIVWGGAWDRTLADFGGSPDAYAKVVAEYVTRRKAAGHSSAFIDGPHYELKL